MGVIMAHNFAKGFFTPKNPEKYIGNKKIFYRSSWEFNFCMFCDTNPSILKWASESVSIPYLNPLTNKKTVYIPDFFIQYVDKAGKIHVELIEIKPANQQLLEKVGKNKANQAMYIKNQAKWAAARLYCKQQGIVFRVINQYDMFHNGNGK
jgi:hypothetical protein